MMTDSGQVAAGLDCDADGFGGGDCEGLSEPDTITAEMLRRPLRTGPPILFDGTPGPAGETLSVGIPAHGWPEGWHRCPCGCTQMVYEQDRGPTHAVPGDELGRRAAWVLTP